MTETFKTPSPEKFLSVMESLDYTVFREIEHKPFNVNIVGFRNPFGRVNYFDDVIAVYYEQDGKWNSYGFQATTRPGLTYILPWFKLDPINKYGAAILVPGQYLGAYAIGKHRGQYEALVQTRGEVKVYRDNNKDSVYDIDERTIQKGLFGINVHRASLGAKIVGPNSAGCQVIKERADFSKFMELCRESAQYWTRFSYTLIEL